MIDSTETLIFGLTARLSPLKISIQVAPAIAICILITCVIALAIHRRARKIYKVVEMEIAIGSIGKIKLQPRIEDIQIAHKIWTQLITRKVAIKIDPNKDVIIEVYNSWYAMFSQTRELISNIPANLIKNQESTRSLIEIATQVLNEGLRPHLTHWHSEFRNWHEVNKTQLQTKTPQEYQREFPAYQALVDDMLKVNTDMIRYAGELKKLIDA